MILNKNQSGFTMLEILVALGIMTIGFLAMAQMQFLSLRQSNIAEDGTTAMTILQTIADKDIEDVKRLHVLNSRVFLDEQSDKPITTQDDYCDGSPPSNCFKPPCSDPCSSLSL